jgi:peroxiredoxin
MDKDVHEIFSIIVEVDETYVGGQWKHKQKSI